MFDLCLACARDACSERSLWLWLQRAGGLVLAILGYGLVAGPAQHLASWIPLLGGLVGWAVGMAAAFLGLSHALAVICVAWLAQRPLLCTFVLLLLALAVGAAGSCLKKKAGGGGKQAGGGHSASNSTSSSGTTDAAGGAAAAAAARAAAARAGGVFYSKAD